MALKAVLATLDGLDEAIQKLYKKEGDKFVLDLSEDALSDHPNVSPLSRALEHERTTRKDSQKLTKELQEKFKDLDPDAAREALKLIEESGDKDLLDEGKIDELVEKKVARMKQDFDAQIIAKDQAIEELTTGNKTLNGELADIRIYDAVKDAALAKGARPEALKDIANRANGTWSLKDGQPTALNGEEALYGKDGNPLSIGEWVETLSTEANYLFEPNKGGGGTGGEKNTGGSGGGGIKIISPQAAGDNLTGIADGSVTVDRG